MEELEIIDCHEHIPPEEQRTDLQVDVFTLFSGYTRGDLAAAGMSDADYQFLFDHSVPLESRWTRFAPYWEQIRFGSYARAALLAARKFYGFEDINGSTYEALSSAIQEANKPGIYERVLRKECRIRTCLTQCSRTDLDSSLLTPVMPLEYGMETSWKAIWHPLLEPGARQDSLDDYLDAVRTYVKRVKAEGAVGFKMRSYAFKEPDREEAARCFELLRTGVGSKLSSFNPLRDFVVDRTIMFAQEQDMVIAVHAGYWGDFRQLDPLHMIPILQRHPKARFDIYHLGYPWVRETLMLAKGFPNVWLNLCWTHIISQHFAVAAMEEAIDLIPMNKVLAFGGDYATSVEKVYGHLVMARENIGRVFARRIQEKRMTENQALTLINKWFLDNPKELYRLDERVS